jgi:hypothetical protein
MYKISILALSMSVLLLSNPALSCEPVICEEHCEMTPFAPKGHKVKVTSESLMNANKRSLYYFNNYLELNKIYTINRTIFIEPKSAVLLDGIAPLFNPDIFVDVCKLPEGIEQEHSDWQKYFGKVPG